MQQTVTPSAGSMSWCTQCHRPAGTPRRRGRCDLGATAGDERHRRLTHHARGAATPEGVKGRVLYISATSVGRPLPGMGAYATSKAALEELARAWRSEYRDVAFSTVAVGMTLGTGVAAGWDRPCSQSSPRPGTRPVTCSTRARAPWSAPRWRTRSSPSRRRRPSCRTSRCYPIRRALRASASHRSPLSGSALLAVRRAMAQRAVSRSRLSARTSTACCASPPGVSTTTGTPRVAGWTKSSANGSMPMAPTPIGA